MLLIDHLQVISSVSEMLNMLSSLDIMSENHVTTICHDSSHDNANTLCESKQNNPFACFGLVCWKKVNSIPYR